MMELGYTYLVEAEGLSQLTREKFTKHLTSLLTGTVIVDILPKVYALTSGLSDVFRKSVIDDMRKKLLRRPLAAGIEELLEGIMRDVPQFTRDLLKSYMDTPHGRYHRVKTASAPAQEHNQYLVRTIAK
ncbi:hypothetical protein E4U52_007451 [Claviceps spartinae]|nr:hypothetical protein E4U52_007451 [Claviceps spartinae]